MSRAPRAPRRENWEVEAVDHALPEGEVEVRQGKKIKGKFRSEREAFAFIVPRYQEGQKVVTIEPDGYRLDVTRRFLKTR